MKNLKLFIAPLIGAAFLTACGPKAMDFKDFRAKVEENFNSKTIETNYKGKTMHMIGTVAGQTCDESSKITGIAPWMFESPILTFTFDSLDFVPLSAFTILSPDVVDVFGESKEGAGEINYFISGDTYTIEGRSEVEGQKGSAKYVFKDLVIIHFEGKNSSGSESIEINIDFKYE